MFEQWLQAKGFDPAALTEAQKTILKAAHEAELRQQAGGTATTAASGGGTATVAATPATRTMDEIVQAARQEDERKTKITELVAAALAEPGIDQLGIQSLEALGRQGIEGKWPIEKFELEMLRARRPAGNFNIHRPVDRDVTDKVIEAAVCMTGKLSDVEKHYDERTLDVASSRFKNGLGLDRLIVLYARRAGFSGFSFKESQREALQCAFQPNIRAAGAWGPSTGGGIAGILSNVANKFLKDGFDAVDNVWRLISAIRSVSDFKQISTYSLTGGLTYEKVAPGGEIKHGQIGSEVYTNQVDTRGRMIGLDRRDLINDDLDALTGVGKRLGRGAALSLNRDFWTVFLNNSSFFTSGRGNVSTGGGSALAIAGLDAANQKFLAQTDPDGEPMGVAPTILLVPSALQATAMQLMSPMLTIGSGTAATGSTNPWGSRFKVLSSPYMSNANYTGYSAAAWYLLADPADVPVIETAFLNGQETPTVETADADFGMLGIAMRAYLDYGIAFQEYRGGVRSAGS